jgi:hypothetical protein
MGTAVRRSGSCEGNPYNPYMSQPACEWLVCQRVGAKKPIPNCTRRPARAYRRSFRGATVETTAIKGNRAAVRFTNDYVVELDRVTGGPWTVIRVGENAGRGFGLRE